MNRAEFSRIAAKVANKNFFNLKDSKVFVFAVEQALTDNPDNPYEALPDEYKKMFDSVV